MMDFGLARRVEDLPAPDAATRELAAAQLTAHGMIVGTPDYMSPEQVKGAPLDARSDFFSFGVMLAEMIERSASVSPAIDAGNAFSGAPRPTGTGETSRRR